MDAQKKETPAAQRPGRSPASLRKMAKLSIEPIPQAPRPGPDLTALKKLGERDLLRRYHQTMSIEGVERILDVLMERTSYKDLSREEARAAADKDAAEVIELDTRLADHRKLMAETDAAQAAHEAAASVGSVGDVGGVGSVGDEPAAPEPVGGVGTVGGVGGVGEAVEATTEPKPAKKARTSKAKAPTAPTKPTPPTAPTADDLDEEEGEADAEAGDDEDLDEEGGRAVQFDEVLDFVRAYCANHRLTLRLDGTLSDPELNEPRTFDEIAAISHIEDQTRDTLRHDIKVAALRARVKTGNLLGLAVDQWMREQRQGRRQALFNLTNVPPTAVDPGPGWDALRKLAEVRFDGPPEYGAAVIEQIIWETKRKAWGRGPATYVQDAHFYLFSSYTQWNGKTTLAQNILSPLSEAIRGNLELKAIADNRWHELWKSANALIIDEIAPKDQDSAAGLARLKAIITSKEHNLRAMRSNAVDRVMNRTTLLGTSQFPAIDLFGDSSGMRRYVEVRMREGRRYLDWPEARAVTEILDWPAIWQGVDMFGPSPIMAREQRDYLDELQKAMTPPEALDSFDQWAQKFSPSHTRLYIEKIRTQGYATINDLYETYHHYCVTSKARSLLALPRFEARLRDITRNVSTKKGRTADPELPHHLFEKTDGRKTTEYVYIGTNA